MAVILCVSVATCISLAVFEVNGDTYQPYIVLGPWAQGIEVGPGMVTKGYRLWGTAICGQDLRRAVFDDCDLTGLTLAQCDLRGATFRRVVMKGLNLDDCTFGDNDFTDAVVNGIAYAYSGDNLCMSGQQLISTWSYKNKQLDDCKVPSNRGGPQYDFTGFSLHRTMFYGLTQCRFDRAIIVEASFRSCDLTQCTFNRAHIRKVSFESCEIDLAQLQRGFLDIRNCTFVGMKSFGKLDISGVSPRALSFRGNSSEVSVQGAIISGLSANSWLNRDALMSTKSYAIGDLSGIKLSRCDLSNADLSRQLLVGARFWQCNFTDCNFEDTVISSAEFNDSCEGLTTDQIKSTWNYKYGRMEGIKLPTEIVKAIQDKQ